MEWRLDSRGLEWSDNDGQDHWMPYACVRLATLGNPGGNGWRLRLGGPPGVALVFAGTDANPDNLSTFSRLSEKLINGANEAGCKARFRLNHGTIKPHWLWARLGEEISAAEALPYLPPVST